MLLFLYSSSSLFLKFLVDFPFIMRSPESYLSSPPIIFKSVVFPLPEGPNIETNSLFLKLIFYNMNYK